MTVGESKETGPLFTPLEARFTRWVSTNPWLAVLLSTVTFIGLSTAMTWIGITVSGTEMTIPGRRVTFGIAVTIPLLLSPITFGYIARLLIMLEDRAMRNERDATTDSLTSILNRRGFFKAAKEMRSRPRDLRLAMVDVDDFKLINDRYGHDFGDTALVAIAQWLEEQAGGTGLAARLGGDEFVYLGENAQLFELEKHRLSVDGVQLSLSIGTTDIVPDDVIENVITKADRVLYKLKQKKYVHDGFTTAIARPEAA